MFKILKSRIYREEITIQKMIRLYCSKNHKSNRDMCENCNNLLSYALSRLSHCPYGAEKPACNNCSIHCYRKNEREIITKVMRYSGPKMLFHHPILAIMHLIDRKREAPKLERKTAREKAVIQ